MRRAFIKFEVLCRQSKKCKLSGMKRPWKIVLGISLASLCFIACAPDVPREAKRGSSGISVKRLRQIDEVIAEALKRKDFPGAVILVGHRGKVVYRKAFGESGWVPVRKPMHESMFFDLASITKPVATATSVMILAERGRLSLEEKVKDFIPEFVPYTDENGKPGDDARLWHLLTHTSGLPPYTDAKEVEEKYGRPCPTESLVRHIAGLTKAAPPGKEFQYSCLGYITLAQIIKLVSGKTVADFAAENIFRPLGMKNTFYTPSPKHREQCVPTEVIEGKPLRGVVHDPLARLQGGVSGNAGLFSTVDDLAKFTEMTLNKGEYKGVRVLGPLTVARMTRVFPQAAFAGRGLGWDLDSGYSTNSGDLFGPASYGHTGYTGTSIWIDPETRTYLIFLTNRVHPDDKGAIVAMRSRVANIVAGAITKD